MSKDKRELLAGYVDGELSDEERLAFEKDLADSTELRAELEEFLRLKEMTGIMTYADLPDEVWENYWQSLYKKLERGFGWIFFSVGAIALLFYGVFQFLSELYMNPTTPIFIKIAVTTLLLGVIILLVSFSRERLFAYKRDRYKEVNK